MKTCVECRRELTHSLFSYKRAVCQPCRAVQARRRRAAHREEYRLRSLAANRRTSAKRKEARTGEACALPTACDVLLKVCRACGTAFITRFDRRTTCSAECIAELSRRSSRSYSRLMPRKTASLVGTVLTCKGCGTAFVYDLPGKKGGPRTVFCSTACARRAERRASSAKQYKRKSEKGRRLRIAMRDGWTCGICGQGVASSLMYPHPRSGSIDHIVPVSLGGSNRRDNVRLTHLQCNVERGDGTHAPYVWRTA